MQKNGYQSIYKTLLDQIDAQQLVPGAQIPSEKELVGNFGVSRMTVRRALLRLEEDGKIFRRTGVGTFVKLPGMPGAAGEVRVNIGVELHPEWESPRGFVTDVLAMTQKACAECNCNLLLQSKDELLRGNNVDAAFFLFSDPDDFPRVSQLAAHKPTLLLNRITDDPNLGYVAVDYAAASEQIVRRMLQNGAKRILFVGGSSQIKAYAPYMREIGYRNAHKALGIPVREELIISWEDSKDYKTIAQKIATHQVDIIFLSCEFYMSQVYMACEQFDGNPVVKPYVFSFDSLQDSSTFSSRSVSYGRIPFDDMCRRAVQHLAGRVSRRQPAQAIHEIFNMSYIINNCPFLI